MKTKILSFLAFLFLLIPMAYGQSSWPPPLILTSAPTGSCANGVQAVNITAKTFYYCAGGVWNLASGGGGSGVVGSGSANQLAIYPSNGTTVQGDPLLSDNGTALTYTGTGGIKVGNAAPFNLNITGNASMTGNVSLIGPVSQPADGLLKLDGSGNMTTKPLQGTDSNVLTSGTVSGAGASLCTDASGGATTTGCSTTGAMTRIGQIVVSTPASSETFSSIPGTYSELLLTIVARCSDAATNAAVGLTFNGDGGANYDRQQVTGGATTAAAAGVSAGTSIDPVQIPASTASAGEAAAIRISIPGYAGTTFNKNVLIEETRFLTLGTTSTYIAVASGGNWRSTAAITSLTFSDTAGGNFVAGTTLTLYGIQ